MEMDIKFRSPGQSLCFPSLLKKQRSSLCVANRWDLTPVAFFLALHQF